MNTKFSKKISGLHTSKIFVCENCQDEKKTYNLNNVNQPCLGQRSALTQRCPGKHPVWLSALPYFFETLLQKVLAVFT